MAKVWQQYEQQIESALRESAAGSDATVLFNQKLDGKYSGRKRQIDVLVEIPVPGRKKPARLIADCKAWNKKLNVTHVEAFGGLLEDVDAEMGTLICPLGFTAAAGRRAGHIRGMELSIVELDLLPLWKPGAVTISHTSGTNTAVITLRSKRGRIVSEVVSLDDAPQWVQDAFERET